MIVSIPLLAALLLQTASTVLAEVTVTTVAGGGLPGSFNGRGTSAKFTYPLGIAVDRNGTILVSEKFRNYLRKIDTRGVVTTFPRRAGVGRGHVRGMCPGYHAIAGIATDREGNVYMADCGGETIQKLNPQGQCTTLAGSGESGVPDGAPHDAMFQSPLGVAVDANGNVYVTERSNDLIRRVSPDGWVLSFTRHGAGYYGRRPVRELRNKLQLGIAVNADGYVFVADTENNRIRRISRNGRVEWSIGTGDRGYRNGPHDRAMFNAPTGIVAASDGNLYVTDSGNHRIRKITPNGRVSTIAGSGRIGSLNSNGSLSTFKGPMGIAIEADGNLLVADTGNHAIRKITFSSNGESDDFDIDNLSDDNDDDVFIYDDDDVFQHTVVVYRRVVLPPDLTNAVPPKPINYDVEDCAICYEVKSKDQEFDYCSDRCGQSFHKQCINQCIAHSSWRRCPICREKWVMNKPAIDIPSAVPESSTDESSFASSASSASASSASSSSSSASTPTEENIAEPNLE